MTDLKKKRRGPRPSHSVSLDEGLRFHSETVETTRFINASVRRWRNRSVLGKEFTEYQIHVTAPPLDWDVYRRYSDFEAMHKKLKEIPSMKSFLPKFPPSKLIGSMNPEFIDKRCQLLADYLSVIMLDNTLHSSMPVLLLLGALSDHSSENGEVHLRLHLEKIIQTAQPGDVVLFRTRGVLQSVTRTLTQSPYDHSAIVVRIPYNSQGFRGLYLLEATMDGVKKYSLSHRLRSWYCSQATVVIRHLRMQRTPQKMQALADFAEAADGMPYSITPAKLLRRKSDVKEPTERENYFCSELVASAYKVLDILPQEVSASSYLPAAFGETGKLRLINGATLSNEILVKFEKIPVAHAIERRSRLGERKKERREHQLKTKLRRIKQLSLTQEEADELIGDGNANHIHDNSDDDDDDDNDRSQNIGPQSAGSVLTLARDLTGPDGAGDGPDVFSTQGTSEKDNNNHNHNHNQSNNSYENENNKSQNSAHLNLNRYSGSSRSGGSNRNSGTRSRNQNRNRSSRNKYHATSSSSSSSSRPLAMQLDADRRRRRARLRESRLLSEEQRRKQSSKTKKQNSTDHCGNIINNGTADSENSDGSDVQRGSRELSDEMYSSDDDSIEVRATFERLPRMSSRRPPSSDYNDDNDDDENGATKHKKYNMETQPQTRTLSSGLNSPSLITITIDEHRAHHRFDTLDSDHIHLNTSDNGDEDDDDDDSPCSKRPGEYISPFATDCDDDDDHANDDHISEEKHGGSNTTTTNNNNKTDTKVDDSSFQTIQSRNRSSATCIQVPTRMRRRAYSTGVTEQLEHQVKHLSSIVNHANRDTHHVNDNDNDNGGDNDNNDDHGESDISQYSTSARWSRFSQDDRYWFDVEEEEEEEEEEKKGDKLSGTNRKKSEPDENSDKDNHSSGNNDHHNSAIEEDDNNQHNKINAAAAAAVDDDGDGDDDDEPELDLEMMQPKTK